MKCRCCRDIDASRIARGFKTCAGCGAGGSIRGRKRYDALLVAGRCVNCAEWHNEGYPYRLCLECRDVVKQKREARA
jgi:hypothetical protein